MNRNYALDGVRGYAALVVVIYHSIMNFDFQPLGHIFATPIQKLSGTNDIVMKILYTIFNGKLAVSFFFILSGVVLFQSLNKNSQRGVFATIINFSIKRILRIYPALVCCILAFFLIFRALHFAYPGIFSCACI